MLRPVPQAQWVVAAADRFAALAAWRQAHRRATWAEIMAAAEVRRGPVRAQLLGDTAASSDAATLTGARPVIPDRGGRLGVAGVQAHTLHSEGTCPSRWNGPTPGAPQCRIGLFPLDEELASLSDAVTPTWKGHLSKIGRFLDRPRRKRPLSEQLVLNNGPELISSALVRSPYQQATAGHFIDPG